jgi:hypothetical protein
MVAVAISFTVLREPAALPAAKLSPVFPRLEIPAPAPGSAGLAFRMTLQHWGRILQLQEEPEAAVIRPRVPDGSRLVATQLVRPTATLFVV